MCLLAVAWRATPTERLVLIGNRDEVHTRPAAPMDWWQEPAPILAGRDLLAGGSWLGIDRRGRFAVVTNFRGSRALAAGLPSRGEFVPRYLSGEFSAWEFAGRIEREAARYAGFSLLLGDDTDLVYVTNRQSGPQRLAPGHYGLSNHLLDTPWHKLVQTRAKLSAAVAAGRYATPELLDLMQDATPGPDAEVIGTGLDPEFARRLSAAFVSHPQYGTRCTSALVMRHDGTITAAERSFDAHGAVSDRREFTFTITPAGTPRSAV
jgi:uncharacterized protein with NRDE domain